MSLRKLGESYKWLVKANSNLDNALYIYKNIDELTHFKKVWSRDRIVERYLHAFKIFIKRIITYFSIKRNFVSLPDDCKSLLYVNSSNTYHSLKFLKSKTETCFFEQSNRIASLPSAREVLIHRFKTPIWITILSVFNFPIYVLFFWNKCIKHPHLYFENWGKDYVNIKLLRNLNRIEKVIFANDHNVENRLFKIASEHLKIKTVYLQHASVTSLFPQLDFDQSFLFGEEDFTKYKIVGEVKGEIILAGSPKLDELYEFRRDSSFRQRQTIGLALNANDETDRIISLVDSILAKSSYNVIIRMHPGDKRQLEFDSVRIKLHNATKVPLIEFFSKIDFLIAGDSSIHLECMYLNIPSFFIELGSEPSKDHYHFLKSGLVQLYPMDVTSDVVFRRLASSDIIDKLKLKKFIHSVGENYDGKVQELVNTKLAITCTEE